MTRSIWLFWPPRGAKDFHVLLTVPMRKPLPGGRTAKLFSCHHMPGGDSFHFTMEAAVLRTSWCQWMPRRTAVKLLTSRAAPRKSRRPTRFYRSLSRRRFSANVASPGRRTRIGLAPGAGPGRHGQADSVGGSATQDRSHSYGDGRLRWCTRRPSRQHYGANSARGLLPGACGARAIVHKRWSRRSGPT